MISVSKQLKNHAAHSLRELARQLKTERSSASEILKIAAIQNRFFAEGGGKGRLGPPVSPVLFSDGHAERRYFSGGSLRLSDDGTMSLNGLLLAQVDYVGFRCDAESSELSAQDEPYLLITAAGKLKRVGPVSVDTGDVKTDDHATLISIDDSVAARDLYIDIIVKEHDEGDPDQAEKAVRDALTKISQDAANLAVLASDGDGVANKTLLEFSALAANPMLGMLAPIISKVLGLEDDDVGSTSVALFQPTPAATKPVSPSIIGHANTLEYNVVAPLIGADANGNNQGQGVYTVYFRVLVYAPPVPIFENQL